MLMPATSATSLVVKPFIPRSPRTRAPAPTMASTIARERAWRGSLRIGGGCFSPEDRERGMRVDIGALLPENVSKLLAFPGQRKDISTMSAAALLVTLFQYQAW